VPTPSDLFLSPDLTEQQAREYLATLGFRDPAGTDGHLQAMAEDIRIREALGRIAGDLLPALTESPDPDAAVVALSRYVAARTGRAMFLDYLGEDPRAMHVLTYMLGASPFLGEILIRNPEYFHWLVAQIERSAPDRRDLEDEIVAMLANIADPAEALDTLKRWKRRETLRIATRDLLRRETVETATAQVSDLAGVIVDCALRIVTRQLLAADSRTEAPGVFSVIGMGKLGGGELNYSSDIDVMYVFDAPAENDSEDGEAREFFQRLGKRLTAALSEHTSESYLYRVDLRLRPGGARGPIAYSLDEYDEYYNSWGETFERFALIKAQPVAGDTDLGRRFVDRVQPFVYRKYLDRAALEELSRYKARSDRALGARADDRNVKAGRGGIREVELFTQVFQLTYGGQNPSLRQPGTLAALGALARAGLVAEPVRHEMSHAYVFLRSVEHRLQLVHETQTHRMSDAAVELEISARRLGLGSSEDLAKQLDAYRERVHGIYLDLFEHRKETSGLQARELFRILNEEIDESEAAAYLSAQGFSDGRAALAAVLSMNRQEPGGQAASAARNVLANLLAVLMSRITACARPEQVLHRLEQLATATGSATLFYRSLLEHEALREVVVLMLDSGDLPAQRLIRYPELLDSLVLPDEDLDTLGRKLAAALDNRGELEHEERVRQVRRLKQVEEFKIVRDWLAAGPAYGPLDTLQEKLSVLAELCVERAARWHVPATLERGQWAVMALGKLGGIEMAVHSDLDLVIFYDGDPEDARAFEQYQTFVEAMQHFLDRPTADGIVYHMDTRLRPEGRKGALAIPVSMFQRYLETRAEIWERLAWTRCRPLAAPAALGGRIQSLVDNFVYGPWNPAIPGYMKDVRTRMEREIGHEGQRRLHFKAGKGGLADIDFALQMTQIREGHRRPEFRVPGTRRLLGGLPPTQFLPDAEGARLRDAHRFLRSLELIARMDNDSNVSWISADPGDVEPLGVRMGFARPAGDTLLERYRATTDDVRGIYLAVIERLASG
jgi:[glutamine synthetase] adenylyltransferase / [glutamine synthetase]-adenylyl-L-tyrosine phosphorylase